MSTDHLFNAWLARRNGAAGTVSLTKRDALTGEPIRTYVIGHNLAGYCPDLDSVEVIAGTWSEACELFRIIVREYADRDDDAAYDAMPEDAHEDDHPTMLATVDSILTDDGPERCGLPYAITVEDGSGRHVAFWLTLATV